MTNRTNQELLLAYHRNNSEEAFTELLHRYLDFVYSTAVRLVKDSHLAADVTQRTFVALAQNAGKLVHRPVLTGWLHRTTRNFALMTIRAEERRRVREQTAALMQSQPDSPESDWNRLAPHLDEVLSDLSDSERDVVMLRYFEGKTSRDIAQVLGLSEQAAQKRVTRALERLRKLLARRGVAITSSVLALNIPTHAVQSAPAALYATLPAQILTQAAASPLALLSILHPLKIVAQFKTKSVSATLALLACLSLVSTGVIFGRSAAGRHWSALKWQYALAAEPSRQVSSSMTSDAQENVGRSAKAAPQRPSVSEIMAEAAAHFRLRNSDPDASAKGFVALEKLQPTEISEALREAERYQNERQVFNSLMPLLMGLWAQTDPRAARDYSLKHLTGSPLALALEYVCQGWARKNPMEAWAWFIATSDSGQVPINHDTWRWLPEILFAEWVARDPAVALSCYATLSVTQQDAATHGIAGMVGDASARSGILNAIPEITDENARRRVAAKVGASWATIDPIAAAEWAATLVFENPSARLEVIAGTIEEWWRVDPHAAVQWTLTHAPREVRDQLAGFLREASQSRQ